jgi:hypothetical protein
LKYQPPPLLKGRKKLLKTIFMKILSALVSRPVIASLAFCLFMLAVPVISYSESPQVREYGIKAAYLLNFAKLTEWPSGTFASHENAFIIGILGNDPFGRRLDLLRDRTVGGRRVVIKSIDNISESSACDLLFIASSESDRLQQIIAYVRKKPVLTVSDIAGFENSGGIIAFFLKDDHVRFRINIDAARRANLNISSHLLELAEIVREK